MTENHFVRFSSMTYTYTGIIITPVAPVEEYDSHASQEKKTT